MKSEEYTDPILYKEGFFKDEESEKDFLKSLRTRVETAINNKKAGSKMTETTHNKITIGGYTVTVKTTAKQIPKTVKVINR